MSDHRSAEKAQKREAAVQGMMDRGYTRERAEYLLFEVVGKTLFGPGGRFEKPSTPAGNTTSTEAGDPS